VAGGSMKGEERNGAKRNATERTECARQPVQWLAARMRKNDEEDRQTQCTKWALVLLSAVGYDYRCSM